jgi:hypothetical protein
LQDHVFAFGQKGRSLNGTAFFVCPLKVNMSVSVALREPRTRHSSQSFWMVKILKEVARYHVPYFTALTEWFATSVLKRNMGYVHCSSEYMVRQTARWFAPGFGYITMVITIALRLLQLGVCLISGSWWASQIPVLTVPTVWLVARTWTGICFQSAISVLADCTPSTTYCCTRHVSVNNLAISYSGVCLLLYYCIIVPFAVRWDQLTMLHTQVIWYCACR